jgi:predicted transcriptional regulator
LLAVFVSGGCLEPTQRTTTPDESIDRGELLALTAEIVAAHVGNNAVAAAELGELIQSVFDTLGRLASDEAATSAELTPAVPIRRSVTDDHIVRLECGKKLKILIRHVRTAHGLAPQAYRAKWGLKPDYPMVAPAYSAKRQALAKEIGLGRKPAPTPAPELEPKPKRRRKTPA